MTLEAFRASLINDVNLHAAANRDFKQASFLAVTEEMLAEAGEVADLEPSFFRATGRRNRNLAVDAYAEDEVDGSIRLFLAEVDLGSDLPTMDRTTAVGFLGRLTAFAEEAMSGSLHQDLDPSSPGYGLARLLAKRMASEDPITRIRAYLLTDKALTTTQRDWPEGKVGGVKVEYHIWDIERLHRLHLQKTRREDLTIDLRPFGDGLPCVDAGLLGERYRAYLTIVPGAVLAGLYDEYGSRLLEGNVRSFLALRGKVNKGIANTIRHEPDVFFAYNNGIAATALAAKVEKGADGVPRLVEVTDLQIVNGGQTTASVWNAWRMKAGDISRVAVPMKLSIVGAEESVEMIPRIAQFANTQNKVSDADFFANHPYHRRLEEFSRRLLVPATGGAQYDTKWFYERSRGQYVNETLGMTRARQDAFEREYPRTRLVTKTDIAKSEMAWRGEPHIVSRGAQKNFTAFAEMIGAEWTQDETRFHEAYFRAAMARVRIFRVLEKLVSDAPWYQGGYRANIVAYTLARLGELIRTQAKGHELDFERIWREDRLSPALTEQLGLIAHAMSDVIMSAAGGQNISEWAKLKTCWDRATRVELSLTDALRSELVDPEVRRDKEKSARQDMKVISGIVAQTMVVALGADYWAWVRDWGASRRLLTPKDEAALRGAIGFVPEEHQSKRLLELKRRLEEEGMEPRDLPEVSG